MSIDDLSSQPLSSASGGDESRRDMSRSRLTSKDIARLAGVSQTTVSRVLRGESSVRPGTRDHVLAVIRDHNYHPSAAARSMKTRRANMVAVVVTSLSNPLYPYMLQMISTKLREHGLLMSVWETEPHSEQTLVQAIGEGTVDGVLAATATERDFNLFEKIAAHTPVVLLNRTVQSNRFDQVCSDNFSGAASVARYFLKHQRQQLGILSGPLVASTIREREAGFTSVMEESGLTLSKEARWSVDVFSYESGYEAGQALLSVCPNVDAIFCTNDILAIGACDGVRAMGHRIPDDIWIVGYDDIPMASWGSISLSTVRQPLQMMVSTAVAKLLSQINGSPSSGRLIALHGDLIVRSTSG